MFGLYIAGAVVYGLAALATVGAVRDATVRVPTLLIGLLVEFLLIWGVFHS